ncbi:TetR family transcriptional regulator [Streptomyces sp. NPDC059570]|uniref:TetR family transcriptional regulator n=1 Tax=unclassified Streptomyces TaxID=2593676 RepID=UPI00368AEB87
MGQSGQACPNGAKRSTRQPVQERGERTRRLVLEAAARLIADRGVSQVSLPMIYREAGVTKGAGQHAFAVKEDLLHAIVWEGFSMDAAQLGTPRLQAIADAANVLSWLTVFSPVVRAAARIATEQDYPETFGALWKLYVPVVTDILVEAQQEEELLEYLEDASRGQLEEVAWHLVMTFTGWDRKCRLTVDEMPARIASMNRWAYRGIATPAAYEQMNFDVQRGLTLIAESEWARGYITDVDQARAGSMFGGTPA